MSDPSGVVGAWHPDPLGRYAQRWWDGVQWTDQVVDAGGQASTDPSGIAASPVPGGLPPAPAGFAPTGFTPGGGTTWAPPPSTPLAASPSNGMAIAALILGIGSLVFCWIPFLGLACIPFALVAIVLGFVGLSAAGRLGTGKGLAVAGIATGVVAIAVAILLTVIFAVWIDNATDGYNSDSSNGICNPDRFFQDPDC